MRTELLALALLLVAGHVAASVETRVVSVRARGRAALTVQIEERALSARACAAAPCAGGVSLPLAAGVTLHPAETRVLDIGQGVQIVAVRGERAGAPWAMVLAPPRAPDGAPDILFTSDPDGKTALELAREGGVDVVRSGRFDSRVTVCGRRSLLSPARLDPVSLRWEPIRVSGLTSEERARATRVTATVRAAGRAPLGRVLTAHGASSARAAARWLTDGDPATSWSSAGRDGGEGEFVAFRAPRAVALTKLAFTVRPTTGAPEHGVAPRSLYVAVDDATYEVALPEDGWLHPGRSYEARLPTPVTTSCLAVVLGEAYVGSQRAPETTLAEVFAETTLDDGVRDHAGLVGLLDADPPVARAAAAVLARAGEPGLHALGEAFPRLGARGRALALDVLDEAPCDAAAPRYVEALGSERSDEAAHARRRLVDCKPASIGALVAAARDPASPSRSPAVSLLVALSPPDAVRALGPLAVGDDPRERRRVRGAVEHALTSARSTSALVELFARGGSSRQLARALGLVPDRPLDAPALQALEASLTRLGDGFDEAYLATPGIAALAASGSALATTRLRAELSSLDARLRAVAALHAGKVRGLEDAVARLHADPDPRVREAVARGLAGAGGEVVPPLSTLASDDWAFVRRAAYESLVLRPLPAFDALIARRLTEERSSELVEILVRAVQARGGGPGRDTLVRLTASDDTPLDVRVTAVRALGELCDVTQLSLLTSLAGRAAGAKATDPARRLGGAAILALGKLHPADLAARLSGLRGDDTAPGVRHLARAALAERDVCGAPR